MATIKEITSMCRAGNTNEAYSMAMDDLDANRQNVWAQREVGWALFYLMKKDIEDKNHDAFKSHLEELTRLDLLTQEADGLIFDNILWKIAEYLKIYAHEDTTEASSIFTLISKYKFAPSKGYSYLLKVCLKLDEWDQFAEFVEWWGLDSLMEEDYQQFRLDNGRKIMSLAEQTYIAYSKRLLKSGDKDRIATFIPMIEELMDKHPEMIYPGYFCGKLMLATGAEKEDALDKVMPFARKKKADFWVWQLLSEMYRDETDKRLACLLRATHCGAQETFLGKVRIGLATIYIELQDYARAKHHIDCTARCYMIQGWRVPYELESMTRDPLILNATADSSDGIEYMKLTNNILARGANTSIAIVTYIDQATHRATIVYGGRKRAMVKLKDFGMKVKVGMPYKIAWTADGDKINVSGCEKTTIDECKQLPYVKAIEGMVEKRADKPFAFIKSQSVKCFIPPTEVDRTKITGGEHVQAIIVYNYNKKKNEWNWTAVSITKL